MAKVTNEEMRARLQRIVEYWSTMPIRATKNGKWGSYYLSELDNEQVANWIISKLMDMV